MEQPLASQPAPFAATGEPTPSAPTSPNTAASRNPYSLLDQQTLSQLRRGNWSAMEELVHRYQDRLFNVILRIVAHPDDAADLVQETFVRALQNISKFEGKSALYTWLFRIAVNLALSHRRAAKYRRTTTLDGDPASDSPLNRQAAGLRMQLAQHTELDPAANAETHLEHERLLLALAALAALDPDTRAIIILRDIEECDYDQIADILQLPLGTVKSRLFRARSTLRELLSTDSPQQKDPK